VTSESVLSEWAEVYPLGDLLVRSAQASPDRTALVLPDQRYTYADLLSRSLTVARGLIGLGVERGDKVGVLTHNGIEIAEAIFGVSLFGGVPVPINARHRASELDYIVENAELAAILTLGSTEGAHLDFPDLLAQGLPGLAESNDPSQLTLTKHPRLHAVVALAGQARQGLLARTEFDKLASSVGEAEVHRHRACVKVRDIALILYTSGTTANPKGCALSHEAVTRGALQRARFRYEGDVTWGAGPLYHVGCLSPFIGSIGAGGTYVTDVFFDPGRAIRLLEEEKVAVAFPWFPALIQPILDHPDFDPPRLSALRSILVIGPRPLIDQVQETFPQVELIAACGMTETAGIYAVSTPDETAGERAEAQGKAVPGVEVRIVDVLTQEELPDGEMGEIHVRGHCVMTEYHRDPAKTKEALDAEGWLHTGDLYSRTPDGRVIFHGRLKDMLKVGGENVATIEIESYLCQHPAVRMASVVGRADARLDEVPVAFVELEQGMALTQEALIAFCQGQISRYKIPAEVYFLKGEEWPMSTSKIDKRGLRARLRDHG
jgi:acyl-CoA synthetase (AMP-forming)/AMP-acid ligase II